MMRKYDSDFFDAAIKRAGFEILEEAANEMPPKDEAKAFFSNISTFDIRMQKVFKKEQTRERMRKIRRITLQVAVAIVAIIIVSGIAIMSSEALRIRFLNLFRSSNEVSTKVQFVEDTQEEPQAYQDDSMYIPEGFELVESKDFGGSHISVYKNQQEKFRIERSKIITEKSLDNERFDYKEMTIEGQTAYVAEEKGTGSIMFHSDEYAFHIFGDICVEELIKIAESLMK